MINKSGINYSWLIMNQTNFCNNYSPLFANFRTDMKIQDKFKTIKKIGSGAFGEIFKGMF